VPIEVDGFGPDSDRRVELCCRSSSVVTNLNMSSSFDPEIGLCVCCIAEHPITGGQRGDPKEATRRSTFVLSDQAFPATVHTADTIKECMLVLRIENRMLEELVTQFGKKVYVEGVNPGSVVLLSSFTHLATVRLEQYCRELGCKWGD